MFTDRWWRRRRATIAAAVSVVSFVVIVLIVISCFSLSSCQENGDPAAGAKRYLGASERRQTQGNPEREKDPRQFPGTLVVCIICFRKGTKQPSKVKADKYSHRFWELAGACHWLRHEMTTINRSPTNYSHSNEFLATTHHTKLTRNSHQTHTKLIQNSQQTHT